MKTISKLMITGLLVLFAVALNAQTIEVELKIADTPGTYTYEAAFAITYRGATFYIGNFNVYANVVNNINLVSQFPAMSLNPDYKIWLSVYKKNSGVIIDGRSNETELMTYTEIVNGPHGMKVTF